MMLPMLTTGFVLLFIFLTGSANGQYYRGDSCRMGSSSAMGRCILIRKCPYAIDQVHNNLYPQLCGFYGVQPIVCCPLKDIERPKPSTLTPQIESKSSKKCTEYTVPEDPAEISISTSVVVIGGVNASAEEFPHMAILGYGDESDIQWLCGGSLISEDYILTAAHCTYSQEHGDVKFVKLGDLNIKIDSDDAQPQIFKVTSIHRHPQYKPPIQYHDIALLKLDKPANFTRYVRPACLQNEYEISDETRPIATGWGKLAFIGDSSDVLMKVTLSFYTYERCKQVYVNSPKRSLPKGIIDEMQICAGGVNESKDTCQGDSGGPLQVRSMRNFKLFYIVGITSFGKGCGVINTPGVYTRVSHYINWIEETVWPN